MAQDIDLLGAVYPDVPAVQLPKDGGGTALFTDVSDTTADAADVADGEYFYTSGGLRSLGTGKYAAAPAANGNATAANAILYGNVDNTSTSTVFTATVAGLTSLYDGVCVMLHNGVVTSASGFTVNINGLGAKKCYSNLTNATQDTTIFNVAYTMLFVYSTALDSGAGGWWIYRGYDANTNTIGYQLRTNSGNLVAADTGYRYRIWLTSADGAKWVPINTSTSTNATTARTLNTRKINPFGPIVYRPANNTCTAGTGLGATGIWQQYTLTIGYSYVITLTYPAPVYLRCTPQADGSAVMNDITQALPATNDGKIYIYLGTAYSATAMELQMVHPVYWHDGTALRLWTGAVDSGGGGSVEPATTAPAMDGTAAVGTSVKYARADHVHPTDTSRQAEVTQESLVYTGDRVVFAENTAGGWRLHAGSAMTPNETTPSFLSRSGTFKAAHASEPVPLYASDWSNNSQTIQVSIVGETRTVIVGPDTSFIDEWTSAGVYCSAQGNGTLTFTCANTPSGVIMVNVIVLY